MANIDAILAKFTREEISATAAQTQTYPEYSGRTDEIFADLSTGKFRVIQSVDGYTVSTDPDLIKVCNSAHKMSAEELAKELAFAVKIHIEHAER
mgnify:CR=1 FL=1